MTESLSGSFYYGMEELALDGYDSKVDVDPSEYLRLDEDITYQDTLNTLGQNVMNKYSTEPDPTAITSEIMGLREDINLLKQTIENQKDLFHEELGQFNEEIRILKRKLEEETDTESDSVAITPSRTTTRRDTSEERLEERREKWRISSAKFRQKTKQTGENLEKQANELTQKNMELKAVIKVLKEESLRLKETIFLHMESVHNGVTLGYC